MRMNTKIFPVILLIISATFQTKYQFICGEEEKVAKPKPDDFDTEFEKNEEMFLCLHMAPYGMMIPFKTRVDDYGLIEVKDSYKMLIQKKPASSPLEVQVFIQSQFQDRYSDAQPYFAINSKNSQRIVNVLHLVIHLEYGKITKFEWIPGCDGCEKSKEPDTCSTSKIKFWEFSTGKEKNTEDKYCTRSEAECKDKPEHCDLKIFVSWTGTDANLHYMVSYASRLTNFKKFNIQSYYESMNKYASERKVSGAEADIVTTEVKTECFDKPGNCLKTV